MSLMLRKLVKHHQRLISNNVYNPLANSYRTNYYILLPEIPSDTAETNPFMRQESIPPFNEIEPKQVVSGFQKFLVNYETGANSLLDKLDTEKGYTKTFESVFDPIEKLFTQLDNAYKTSRHLAFVNPYSKYHIGFTRINRKYSRAKADRWSNDKLYKTLKEIQSNKHLLTETQNRYIERVMKFCVRNGINLNDADHKNCSGLNYKIEEFQDQFRQILNTANRMFSFNIPDQMRLDNIPLDIKRIISIDPSKPEKGPWMIVADDKVVASFLQNSESRRLRQMLFETYYSRAAENQKNVYGKTNLETIRDLTEMRKRQSKFLGYKNFAEMAIEGKSAASLENVIDLMEKIKQNVKPIAEDDFQKLQSFARKNGETEPLEAFDIPFWQTKHTNEFYNVDLNQLNSYFPYRKVMNGLFELSKQLFNVEFRKDESHQDKLWHPSVEVYNLHDENGKFLSTLMIDPFKRSKKIDNIWSYSGRDSSEVSQAKPLAYLIMNVKDEGAASTLSFNQMQTLFNEFGSVIQILLTQTAYSEFSDLNTTELDGLELSNKFFQQLIYEPEVMKLVSAHTNTGEPLSAETLSQLKNARKNFQSFSLMKQTFLSAFDIECHLTDTFWGDLQEQLWPKFMPYKMNKRDQSPCQFASIFGESFGCNYYSVIWSQMLAADLYEAFSDAGFANKTKIQDVGMRFRNTFLKSGSSLHINEIFRQFRGRNPSMDPFIDLYADKKAK